MKKELIQIAIDGPASSGKSTVAQLVAADLHISYLSTGKIFRSYAYALRDIDYKNKEEVEKEMPLVNFEFNDGNFFINNINISNELLSDSLSIPASVISAFPFVREQYRKDLSKILKHSSIVMDGRDIGTVIIPETPYKYFLDAESEERAKRRAKQNGVSLNSADYDEILKEIKLRDKQDTTRKEAPLKQAKGALYIDSTDLTAVEVAKIISDDVHAKRKELGLE